MLARDLGAEPLLAEATDAVNVAQTERLARIVHVARCETATRSASSGSPTSPTPA